MLFDLSPYINGNVALAALVAIAIGAVCAISNRSV